ncbi:MAG TPA: AbrB/MazE/SpoVT family DNA-binding domain-containing protein [Ignavibacteriales bacterium]|nr:AbrB/MazE/SpoVT family DNA-binding domain-containing protein [Ignavibacteriales bacterium]
MTIVKILPEYQVVIPEEIRKKLKLEPGDELEIFQLEDSIGLIPLKAMKESGGLFKTAKANTGQVANTEGAGKKGSKKQFENVYQFKITLHDVKPRIWRRIQVPETYNFEQLHNAIQDAMGWLNYHLHEFKIMNPKTGLEVSIGIPDEMAPGVIEGKKHKVANYFSRLNSKALYTYDFGDCWEHTIKFEKSLPRDENLTYPVCLAGERACPPEDCGGSWGYEELLDTLSNEDSEDYEEMKEWAGDDFDPEYFNADEVVFMDSK